MKNIYFLKSLKLVGKVSHKMYNSLIIIMHIYYYMH